MYSVEVYFIQNAPVVPHTQVVSTYSYTAKSKKDLAWELKAQNELQL